MIQISIPRRNFAVQSQSATAPRRESGSRWINTQGYTLRKVRDRRYLWTTKAIYECRLTHVMPLTYIDANGNQWRPQPVFETDMGSIPLTAQLVIPRDRGLLSYLLHDDACATGKLQCKESLNHVWQPVSLTRSDRDNLLYDCLIAEGINRYQARAVWLGVRAFAIATWQK